jgi:hypothetical protein
VTLGDELGAEKAAKERQAHGGLEGEVVLVDGLEEGEVGPADAALNAGLGPMGDLLGQQCGSGIMPPSPIA